MALEGDPRWAITPVSIDEIGKTPQGGVPRRVILTGSDKLTAVSTMAARAPVLAISPAGLFDVVRDDLCDDLIGQDWTGSELRFRLGRLIGGEITLMGERRLICGASTLSCAGRIVGLTPAQHRLLALLIRANRSVVPRAALDAAMRDSEPTGQDTRALDMHISRLRMKLKLVTSDWKKAPRIVAHRGEGYALVW